MALKRVYSHTLKRNVVFGRRIPKVVGEHKKFRSLLKKILAVPGSVDWTPAGMSAISQMMLNDQLGDCVIAARYHGVGIETANTGSIFIASNSQVLADYKAIGGYNPNDPNTDQGCDMQTAIKYWMSHGMADGTKLVDFVGVDPTNPMEVTIYINYFGGLDIGLALPDAWINPFPSSNGFVWDVAGDPDPDNGHCIQGGGAAFTARIVGYNGLGVIICTWGLLGLLTWAALAKYGVASAGGEMYGLLTPDIINKAQNKSPLGIDWSGVVGDWDTEGGNVPVPPEPNPPAPPAPPNPTPVATGPSLSDAQGWVTSAFSSRRWIVTPREAAKLASNALAANWPTSQSGKK